MKQPVGDHVGEKRKATSIPDSSSTDRFFISSYHWSAWCKQQSAAVKNQFWEYRVEASNKQLLTLQSVGPGEQHQFDILLKTAQGYNNRYNESLKRAKKPTSESIAL